MKEDNKQIINYLREDVAFNRRYLLKAALAGLMGVSLQSKAATVWKPIGAGSADTATALSSGTTTGTTTGGTTGTIVTGVTTQQGMYVYNGFRYREGTKNFFTCSTVTVAIGQNGLIYVTSYSGGVSLFGGTGYLDDTNKITTSAIFGAGYQTFYAIGSDGLIYSCNSGATPAKKLLVNGYLENGIKAAFIFACVDAMLAVGTNGLLYKLNANSLFLCNNGTYDDPYSTNVITPAWIKLNNTGLLGTDYVKDVFFVKGYGTTSYGGASLPMVLAFILTVSNQLYVSSMTSGAGTPPYLIPIPPECGSSISSIYGNGYSSNVTSSSLLAITDNGSILDVTTFLSTSNVFYPVFTGVYNISSSLSGSTNITIYYPKSTTEINNFLNGAVVSSLSSAKWIFPKFTNMTPILVTDNNKIFYANAAYASTPTIQLRDSNFSATPTFVKYFIQEKSTPNINIYAIGSDGLLYISSGFSAGDNKNMTFTKFNNTGYLYATVKCVDVFEFSNSISTNYTNMFFLGEDGRLYCIGDNYYGTLGVGNTTAQISVTLFNGNGLMDNTTYLKVS
jgi:hypothetical protein